MSQFISPGVLAQLLAGIAGKPVTRDGGAGGAARGARESRVERTEAGAAREEPGSSGRMRVARVRER